MAVCLLFAVAVLLIVGRKSEPSSRGHPLSYWIHQYDPRTSTGADAAEAIAEIGTNALPYLLQWIEYQPPRWRLLFTATRETGRRWVPRWLTTAPGEVRADEAMVAFGALGAAAQSATTRLGVLAREPERHRHSRGNIALGQVGLPAIPELVRILSDTNVTPDARFAATRELEQLVHRAMARGTLGTNAVTAIPALIQNLNDPNAWVAAEAASLLGALKLQASSSVPALTAALANSNSLIRDRAAIALGEFGTEARAALPNLLTALTDTDQDVRVRATNAVLSIAPESLPGSPHQ
jgi:HEAT repeats